MTQIDKVMLQTQLNDLAKKLSQARVQHARFYMKAVEQEFVRRNPARKLVLPKPADFPRFALRTDIKSGM